MDWNLKAASWDLSEFVEKATAGNTDAINGSRSCKVPRSKGDFLVDLKLGQVGNSGQESLNKWKEPTKRARASSSGSHQVFCLVDECNADLGNCRDYHRRHKVCELHSKTAEVMVNGQKQRFCQQCSRFHSLEEFDEGKRSCRKRLDGHNRRRRKSQAEPRSRSGRYFSNYQGSQMLPFSSLHVYPSTTAVKPTWPGVTNSETESRHLNQQQQLHSSERQNLVLGSSSSNYRGGKQVAFFQGENKALQNQIPPEASVWQPLLRAVPFPEGSGVGDSVFCERLTNPVQDSDCALSLLSSPQAQWDNFE